MYYPKLKVVFPHIPKTGGSSLEYFIGQEEHPKLFKGKYVNVSNHMKFLNDLYGRYKLEPEDKRHRIHRAAREYKKVLGDEYDNYYSFSFLRNPFSQIKSLYTMSKTDMEKRGKGHLYPEWEEYVLGTGRQSIDKLKGFLDFPFLLQDKEGNFIVDELFPFEYYQPAVELLGKKLNFTPDFNVRLWSTKPKYEYTPEMVDKVLELYQGSYDLWKKVQKHWEKTGKPYVARKKSSSRNTSKTKLTESAGQDGSEVRGK